MNNTITVNGANRATLAAGWCQRNLQESDWDIEFSTAMFSEEYRFKFNDSSTASIFALRWL